jgi:hypothetical protein
MSVMGRAAIEPDLGIKSDSAGFACRRGSSRGGTVKANPIGCHRLLAGDRVDPVLTRMVVERVNHLVGVADLARASGV